MQNVIADHCLSMLHSMCNIISLVRRSFRSKERTSYVDTTSMCLSVTYNYRLNCWSNCHEIRYRCYLQKFVWEV
jgi:hypothetical protein